MTLTEEICYICEKKTTNWINSSDYSDEVICKKCADELNMVKCASCGDMRIIENTEKFNGKYYCLGCFEDL